MSAIIPFDGSAKLPAYLSKPNPLLAEINRDVVGAGPAFTVLSIKGKVFTLVRGSEKKVLTREIDGEEEAVQSLQVTVVRANTKSRVFYAKAYTEGESDGSKPTCFSHDGVAPDPSASDKQCKTCQGCPQNVWGVKDGKGTACSVNTRLAMVDPNNMGEPFLLRVPAASRAGYAEVCKAAAARNIPYNAMVLRMSFDKEAPAPKLVFKIAGLLDDATYEKVSALYEDDLTKGIVGVHEAAPALAAPEVDTSELDAAIAAKAAVKSAKATTPKAPEVSAADLDDVVEKPKKAEKPKAEPKAPAGLMSELDALLGNKDD
jgi:hypothetical protein